MAKMTTESHVNRTSENTKTKREYKIRYLLLGFNSELDKIELDKNIIIRRGTIDELNDLYKRISLHNVESQKFIIETEFISNSDPFNLKEGYLLMDKLNTFFQIFFNGIFMTAHYLKFMVIDNRYEPIGFSTNTKVSSHFPEYYKIENEYALDMNRKWQSYQVKIENRALKIAVNRFLFSTQKYDNEDQLIDLMIAFEALFLDASEKGELSYKLALRSTYLLRMEFDSMAIFDFMKKVYSLRSSIVHGANFKGNEIKFKEKKLDSKAVVSNLTDLIRVCFQIIILERQEIEIKSFIDAIDSEIVASFSSI